MDVRYYQLANPDFVIPTLEQMPDAIRRAAAEAIAAKAKKVENKDALKEAGEKVYKTGTAAELHVLVAGGFFDSPRTSREAYLALNPDVEVDNLTDTQRVAIGKITGTLSKGKFAKLLDKLEPAPGNIAVRFVLKAKMPTGTKY